MIRAHLWSNLFALLLSVINPFYRIVLQISNISEKFYFLSSSNVLFYWVKKTQNSEILMQVLKVYIEHISNATAVCSCHCFMDSFNPGKYAFNLHIFLWKLVNIGKLLFSMYKEYIFFWKRWSTPLSIPGEYLVVEAIGNEGLSICKRQLGESKSKWRNQPCQAAWVTSTEPSAGLLAGEHCQVGRVGAEPELCSDSKPPRPPPQQPLLATGPDKQWHPFLIRSLSGCSWRRRSKRSQSPAAWDDEQAAANSEDVLSALVWEEQPACNIPCHKLHSHLDEAS